MTREDKLRVIRDCCLKHPMCSTPPKCPLADEPSDGYACSSDDIPNDLLDKRYNIIKDSLGLNLDNIDNIDNIDNVNHPQHYNNGSMECIDEMILLFGKDVVAHFCLCNVWKYRKRALYKNGQEDMDKSDFYINKYKELKESLEH